jgi:hypothetical protein
MIDYIGPASVLTICGIVTTIVIIDPPPIVKFFWQLISSSF